MEGAQKTKTRTTTWSSNSTPGYISGKKRKTLIQKDTYTPIFIASLLAIAKTWKQTKCPSREELIGLPVPTQGLARWCMERRDYFMPGHFKLLGRKTLVKTQWLTPSCESTGITTNCWTIIDRKTLDLTRKDTPHPKTKEKLQWDGRRGAITIKPNLITTGWVTHKLEKNYTTKVHPLEWRFWAPHKASQPGGPAKGGGIPRESDFEG